MIFLQILPFSMSRQIILVDDLRIPEELSKALQKVNGGKRPTKHGTCEKCKERQTQAFAVCPECVVIMSVCARCNPFMSIDKLNPTQMEQFEATGKIICGLGKKPCWTEVLMTKYGNIINKPICSYHQGTIIQYKPTKKAIQMSKPASVACDTQIDRSSEIQPEKAILIQTFEFAASTAFGPRIDESDENDEIHPIPQCQPSVDIQHVSVFFEKHTIIAQMPNGEPCGCIHKKDKQTNITTALELCEQHRITHHSFKCKASGCNRPSMARYENDTFLHMLPFCGKCNLGQARMCAYGHVDCQDLDHAKFYKCANCPNARFLNCARSKVPVLETLCRDCLLNSKQSSS